MANKEQKLVEITPGALLSRARDNLGKAIAGIGSEIKDKGLIQKAGHIVQRVRAHGLLEGLSDELDNLIEAGTIDSEYLDSSQYIDCLQELLQFLDEDIPDEERFKALKSIFFVAASEGISSRDDVLPHLYMRLGKSMSSGAVLVMLAEYKMVNQNMPPSSSPISVGVGGWRSNIANEAGLGHAEMVALFDTELVELNILTPLGPRDINLIMITQRGRLTDLGWGLCEFISHYESVKPAADST